MACFSVIAVTEPRVPDAGRRGSRRKTRRLSIPIFRQQRPAAHPPDGTAGIPGGRRKGVKRAVSCGIPAFAGSNHRSRSRPANLPARLFRCFQGSYRPTNRPRSTIRGTKNAPAGIPTTLNFACEKNVFVNGAALRLIYHWMRMVPLPDIARNIRTDPELSQG